MSPSKAHIFRALNIYSKTRWLGDYVFLMLWLMTGDLMWEWVSLMERVYETHGDGLTCIKLRHGMIQHHCKNNEIFPWFSRLCLKLSNKLRSLLYGVNAFSPTPASYLPHPLYLCQGPSTLSYRCSWVQLVAWFKANWL